MNRPEYLGAVESEDLDDLPMLSRSKRLVVASPHGFCSGVDRAIRAAELLLQRFPGEHIYCLNEIVHNQMVVQRLAAAGMVFVRSLDAVPSGAVLMLSAHGVAPAVKTAAEARGLRVVDATCPFVSKVHAEARRFALAGAFVVCIGHRAHEEVIGIVGEAPGKVRVVQDAREAEELVVPAEQQVAVVTQTTLSAQQVEEAMAVLRRRFPGMWVPRATVRREISNSFMKSVLLGREPERDAHRFSHQRARRDRAHPAPHGPLGAGRAGLAGKGTA